MATSMLGGVAYIPSQHIGGANGELSWSFDIKAVPHSKKRQRQGKLTQTRPHLWLLLPGICSHRQFGGPVQWCSMCFGKKDHYDPSAVAAKPSDHPPQQPTYTSVPAKMGGPSSQSGQDYYYAPPPGPPPSQAQARCP